MVLACRAPTFLGARLAHATGAGQHGAMVRVCFVCLGNICRSPTAEGIFLQMVAEEGLADQVAIDSAGTAGYHVGEPADARSAATAQRRGVPLPSRSRKFTRDDFDRFDLVIAMDRSNQRNLLKLAPDGAARAKVHLLRDYDPGSDAGSDVPDPYYGGPRGFDDVFDICEAGCRGLLEHVRALL